MKEFFATLAIIGAFLWAKGAAAMAPDTSPIQFGPLTRGERNNNPGNLRYDARWEWEGQIGQDTDGYLIFDSVSSGVRAMAKDLLTKFSRGLNTVRSIISIYAPATENNTFAYISSVSSYMNVSPDSPLNLTDESTLRALVRAMLRVEIGSAGFSRLSGADIYNGVARALA